MDLGLQAAHEVGEDAVGVERFLGLAGDDQRGAGFVDENVVNFVHDGVGERALNLLGVVHDHVVAQVIEAEFVVGPVGDVGAVGLLAGDRAEHLEVAEFAAALELLGVKRVGVLDVNGGVGLGVEEEGGAVLEDADAEAEGVVDGGHPLGVALGEVVVDGDQVSAVALEGVEVEGEGGDEGFAPRQCAFQRLCLGGGRCRR